MPDRLAAATRALVVRFRRQRPLRAGSLIVTIFGDALAPRGGAATLGSLIALAAPFGVTERLVRTSVARLAHDDWLVARRNGRLSEYRLSATGHRRFAEATQRIYGAPPQRWAGRWTLLLLPEARAERERLREALRWLGFGQLGQTLLAHPMRSPEDAREQLRGLDGPAARVVVLEAASGAPDTDRQLARAGWDLADLEGRYRRFVRAFEPVREALAAAAAPPAPEAAFVVRTLLVHEYRRIHLRDPLLPASLLPANWIGSRAYELCRDTYGRVFAAAERHLGRSAATLEGPLPAPARETFRRFGGLELR